jgi:FdhD protein
LDKDFRQLSQSIKTKKIRSGGIQEEITDVLPYEVLLTINLNDRHTLTLSCSPSRLIELAIGYLVNNGYVDDYADIGLIRLCSQESSKDAVGRIIHVCAQETKNVQEGTKTVKYLSSACGDIDDAILAQSLKKVKSSHKFDAAVILALNKNALAAQKYKKLCGGLHSASLFDDKANIISTAEDIGRHNCIDKIAGFMLKNKMDASDKILFTTGRISIDVVYKVSRMKIPVLVSNSSVTYSAAEAAKKLDMSVIGYARGERFNMYSYPERIIS